jgi:hypothetical protein
MQTAATMTEMDGVSKKRFVLTQLRNKLQLSDDVEDLIIDLIDLLVQVDKHELRINPNVRSLFSCCGC